jgi:hypothetical protein
VGHGLASDNDAKDGKISRVWWCIVAPRSFLSVVKVHGANALPCTHVSLFAPGSGPIGPRACAETCGRNVARNNGLHATVGAEWRGCDGRQNYGYATRYALRAAYT